MIAIETHCLPMVKTAKSSDQIANFMEYLQIRQKLVLQHNNSPIRNFKNFNRFHK